MKSISYILSTIIALAACACSDSQLEEANGVLSQTERLPTPQEEAVLAEMKPIMIATAQANTKADASSNSLYASEKEFDALDFYTIPYYELDEDRFIENPVPDSLMNCIVPVQNKIFYIGKKNGQIGLLIEALKSKGGWVANLYMEGIDYFKANFSWLPKQLLNNDSKEYFMLYGMGGIYVVYFKNKEPVFCNFIGNAFYNKKEFASLMLRHKNIKDEGKAYFEKIDKASPSQPQ